jgi:hypothetical protein
MIALLYVHMLHSRLHINAMQMRTKQKNTKMRKCEARKHTQATQCSFMILHDTALRVHIIAVTPRKQSSELRKRQSKKRELSGMNNETAMMQ